jgi:hypothetical protein
MNAMKNAAHLLALAIWAILGALFTLKCLVSVGPTLLPVLSFWLWFGGFAALMSWVVTQFKHPAAALIAHAAAFCMLHLIPRAFPFGLLRMGLDLLAGK